jgi:hypothetical protein
MLQRENPTLRQDSQRSLFKPNFAKKALYLSAGRSWDRVGGNQCNGVDLYPMFSCHGSANCLNNFIDVWLEPALEFVYEDKSFLAAYVDCESGARIPA